MNSLLDSLPIAIVLWLVVYMADYYLTLYGRQLWLKNAQPFIKLGGSYELNTYYQKDIDAGRLISRRFIFMLGYGIFWLLFMYFSAQYLDIRQVFPAMIGYLVLPEIVVIATHVQNIRLFKMAAIPGAIQGEIAYARWLGMNSTAWIYGYWSLIFLIFALLTAHWFFVGGLLSCLSTFIRYRQRGIRMRQQLKPVPTPSQ